MSDPWGQHPDNVGTCVLDPPTASARRRARRWSLGVAVLLVVAVGAGGGWLLAGRTGPAPRAAVTPSVPASATPPGDAAGRAGCQIAADSEDLGGEPLWGDGELAGLRAKESSVAKIWAAGDDLLDAVQEARATFAGLPAQHDQLGEWIELNLRLDRARLALLRACSGAGYLPG